MTHSNQTQRPLRWYNSLIVRVILLCAILILCLLGSVYVITRHFYRELVHEMEARTESIADTLDVEFNKHPKTTLPELERELEDELLLDGDVDFDLQPADDTEETRFNLTISSKGEILREVHIWSLRDGQPIHAIATLRLTPQVAIVRAFRNRYMATLTAVFLITLAIMLLVIAKNLRPLRDLSESCARIAEGTLQDVTLRRSSGEIRALEQTFNTMVGSLREKETVEAHLRRTQRLSAIGTLAAGIAHDIRNPLNAIKLLASHAQDSPENAAEHLSTIRKQVNQLEDIVSGFLSLAKERELRPEPSRIDELLEQCVRLVHKDAEARHVTLITELRAGDCIVDLDPKQWTRAILNVLINAMEACPPNGRVRLFSRLTDTTCEIEVRDDGPGLSPEAAERAFDPYFTTKTTGTGLGLSITRGIIEEHGGAIELASSQDAGCQALITLPLKEQAA